MGCSTPAGPVQVAVAVLERGRRADHALARDAVELLGDRPHEVAAAGRADVDAEVVRLEKRDQLAHRPVRDLGVGHAEGGVAAGGEELPDGRLEGLDGDPLEGRGRRP